MRHVADNIRKVASLNLKVSVEMGRVAEVIGKLEAASNAKDAKIVALQSQLDASNAEPKLDDADEAALDKAEADLAGTVPPADTLPPQ